MDMETAKAHRLEIFDLAEHLLPIQLAIPGPKRSAAVFGAGDFKQLFFQLIFQILFIKHCKYLAGRFCLIYFVDIIISFLI